MKRLGLRLGLGIALLGLATSPACKKNDGGGSTNPLDGTSLKKPTVNLFGFEESQIHWLHYNVQRRGRVLLARFNPDRPDQMELLDCTVSGTWDYQDASGSHVEELRVRNEGELRARVPLGVARFSSYVSAGSELSFNYVTVGAYHLQDEPQIPQGDPDCAGATHYVASLSVGAVQFDELRKANGGVDADVPGGAGGGGSFGHERGAHQSWGDVQHCMESNDPSCHTPMQMMLIPLREKHMAKQGEPVPVPVTTSTRPDVVQVDQTASGSGAATVQLQIDQDQWNPGYYMAITLTKLLSFANYVMEDTKYGLDGDASCLFGGYLTSSAPLHFSRTLKGGREYAVFGAGTNEDDINVVISDSNGNIVAQDVRDDSQPVATFTPPADGQYKIQLVLAGPGTETFGGLGIAVADGFRVPPDMMQTVFQNLLNKAIKVSNFFAENGAGGVVFMDSPGDWAMQATILNPKESITQNGIDIPANRAAVFLAVGHDNTYDIDTQVEDKGDGQKWTDTEKDGEPVLVVEPGGARQVSFTVQLSEAPEATLGTSLILLGSQ
jgi:hypothetical protein